MKYLFNNSKFRFLIPNSNDGAVLIISIIVGVIALAAGLTASNFVSRSTRNIVDQESSIRALAISESGVEEVLGATVDDFNNLISDCPITDGTNANESYIPSTGDGGVVVSPSVCFGTEIVNGQTESYYLELATKGGQPTYQMDNLAKDTVLEINTNGLDAKEITLKWSCPDESCDNTKKYASVLFSEVYENSGNYGIQKLAFSPDNDRSTPAQIANGFPQGLYAAPVSPETLGMININSQPINLNTGTKIIRIKPLYADITKLVVTINGGDSFPSEDQGFDIYSTGCTCDNVLSTTSRANQSVRKVKVIKTREHLPAIFDYVLYSGSTTTPLEK